MVLQCKKDLAKLIVFWWLKSNNETWTCYSSVHWRASSDLLGWHLRKAATSKTNVRMVVAAITSLSSVACAEVYITLEAFACLSIYLENESVGSHQCEECLSRYEIGW